MDYVRYILDNLLDKYERSGHFRGEAGAKRAVALRFNKAEIPDYFIDSSSNYKEAINTAAGQLARQGLITIKWIKFEQGNIIERVTLELDKLVEAYALAGRKPRTAEEEELRLLLEETKARSGRPWLQDFCRQMQIKLQEHHTLHPYLAAGEAVLNRAVLELLLALEDLSGEVPKRVFSLEVLGDSKQFVRHEGRVLRILRDFSNYDLPGDRREAWAELGVVDNPQHIYLSGRLMLEAGGESLDLACFYPGLGLPAELAMRAGITGLEAHYIITIENLTSFYQFVRSRPEQDYLAIYLGGYHNRLRREFIIRLRAFMEQAGLRLSFYHWGDIDYGGFQIYAHLRRLCCPQLQPAGMDLETFSSHSCLAAPFAGPYSRKLARLLEQQEYELFHDVIRAMLERGLRLEQEAVNPLSLKLADSGQP